MPERRASVEKAGFGRVVFFLRLRLAVGGLWSFFLSGGRFFNGAESGTAQGRCGGVCGAVRFLPVFRLLRSCFLFWFLHLTFC